MSDRPTLKKSFKPHWIWAIALGSSIGWGAFVQPSVWMSDAGPLGVMLGFVIGALLMMLIAVSYGVLIKSFPVSGGEFTYAFISLGKKHAFVCGWFLTLGYICIVALNASAFALMFKFVFPSLVENLQMYQIAGWDVYLFEIMAATLLLGIFTYFNIKGGVISGRMQFIFCSVMVLSIFTLLITVGFNPGSSVSHVEPYFPTDKTAFAAIISIVAIAPWAYVGFDNVPQAAEEFKFSSKKAFSLIIFALIAAAILYCAMVYTTALIMPWEELANQNVDWGTGAAVVDMLGAFGLTILVLALTMGIFTGLNGFIMSASRLLFAMSRAKFLPKGFSKLHPKYNTPHLGIIFTTMIAMLAPWFGREVLLWIVDMSAIGVSIAYFYTCYTAYSMFKWSNHDGSALQVETVSPRKKLISLIGMTASIIFMGLLLIPSSPAFLGMESRIALVVWVILGVVFYMKKRKELNNISDDELRYLILGEIPNRDEKVENIN
ncbi:APC family permease [Alteribacillus sp. YIM 98480]|uniref:APC family permease n=1 Tax=Alteribacillus sp. YIM 98480 TaxID=2606599 RepID=UPI00131E8368|nr:APC family permease [Alteribacillus sp. YIM 98480]